MRLRRKTSYERKLRGALTRERAFLLRALADEWDEIQQGAKREALVKRSKEVALTTAKTLLVLAAVGGVLMAGAVAPKVFAAFGKTKRRGYFEENTFRQAIRYLRQKRLTTMRRDGQEFRLKLTKAGEVRVLHISYDGLAVKKSKRWDGLWRLVFFDIPDRKKWERDAFRRKLEAFGFYKLQESAYVYPYPCRKEVDFLTGLFFLGSYVRFAETPLVVPDADLQKRFELA